METTPLAALVEASRTVAASRSRIAKVAALSALLRMLAGDEIALGVEYLTGALPQGKIGIGYRSVAAAAGSPPAAAAALTLAAVDAKHDAIAGRRGAGAGTRRAEVLRVLVGLAPADEQ
ncbi:MAG: hypothetical protein AB7G13_32950, partial [Lautropia sp.]